MDNPVTKPTVPKSLDEKKDWWNNLSDQWKKAFNEAMLNKGAVTDMPDEKGFEWILESPNFRFAGPTAFHSNMTFELTDLTGLSVMQEASLVSVTFHKITSIQPIVHLTKLRSLFINDNEIESLDPVKDMKDLRDLYVNGNKIKSLLPLSSLKNLVELQVGLNKLSSFEGLTEDNTEHLERFVGLPNRIAQKEIDRIQDDLRLKVYKS